jgi:hypothetical protein
MRLLVVLNENPVGSHDNSRRYLATLKSRGTLDDYAICPFLARLSSGASSREVEEEIIETAADLAATAVLWCHTSSLEVTAATFSRLRRLPGRPVFGYWEGDMYQWPYKPFPPPARRIACACDVVFLAGSSSLLHNLRRRGCGDIRYAPSPADLALFGDAILLRQTEPEFDLVLIGNNPKSHIPFKTMPGARWRGQIVAMLERKLGQRFAVFGYGWRGPCAQGPVPMERQGEVYARSRAGIGNNNLHAAYYFSNRLPIALSCGAVTLHNWEAGLDQVLGHDAPIRFFRSTGEAWEAVRRVLEADDADLQKERLRARELALARFTFTHVQDYMVAVLRDLWQARQAGAAPRAILNPWLGREQL